MSSATPPPDDLLRDKPASAQRVRLDVGERRALLMETGIRLFTEHRYDEVGIGTIARAAGISRGLLYRYFPDKVSFFAAVVADRLADLAERCRPDPALDSIDGARAAIDAYLEFAAQRPQWYISMYRGSASSAAPVREVLERFDAGLVDGLLTMFGAENTPLTGVLVRGWLAYLAAAGIAVIDGANVDHAELRERCVRVVSAVAEAAALPEGP
ncbi:TetR/AcrR family transcriptional regulator [Sciscionella sediminilitoris]|uniref:TetR/AcrR family transcriptional regulator n=1 Tax=Sciscionella sediminilitoris TaxID=1445613 RepID=UPI00068D04DB|nr:TetR/AcrR family transcriptional regulator [Sciscionella sp. SE31]